MFANPSSLTDRFTWLLDGLCKVIGAEAHQRRMEAALAWAIWNRVRLLGDRLIAIIARARAGKVRDSRTAGAGDRERCAAPRPAARSPHAQCLPRDFGWMTRVLPGTAQFAGVLAYLLRDPETVALVENAPGARRILRPLCEMLGVKGPEFLRRRSGTPTDPPPRPDPPDQARGQACRSRGAERDDSSGAVASQALPDADVAATAEVTHTEEVSRIARAPPVAAPAPAQAPTVPWHQRPGGLYWDGRRLQWS